MWVDLLSMAAVAMLAACIVFIVRHARRRTGLRTAGWVMPAVIGVTMIAYSVWNEYTWFDRMTSALPGSVAVVGQGQRSTFWAPWTYLFPVTVRFIAMDTRGRVQSEHHPDLVLTELLLVERWLPVRRVPVAFDCLHSRRVDLHAGMRLGPDGSLAGAQWQPMDPASPILNAACGSGPRI